MTSWPADWPNPVDLIAVAMLLLYALHGLQQGWLLSIVELGGFALALFLALTFYGPVAEALVDWTGLPYALSKPLAFLLVWGGSDLVYSILAGPGLARLIHRARPSPIDRLLGLWPGAIRGLLAITVLFGVAATIPFPAPIQQALEQSRLSNALEPRASALFSQFSQVFGDAVQETIGLLTVKPDSDERITLRFSVPNAPYDPATEQRMLELVNQERVAQGLKPVVVDERLRESARAHSRDMLARGYFAHVDLDGRTPFERMRQAGARFQAAGENLALAPTVEVAHNGLMNSPGHRANILNPAFGRVGIGVADGGLHGKMFTQNFAD